MAAFLDSPSDKRSALEQQDVTFEGAARELGNGKGLSTETAVDLNRFFSTEWLALTQGSLERRSLAAALFAVLTFFVATAIYVRVLVEYNLRSQAGRLTLPGQDDVSPLALSLATASASRSVLAPGLPGGQGADSTAEHGREGNSAYWGGLGYSAQQSQDLSVVLVSAFWRLPTSKHSEESYKSWLRRFFSSIACNRLVLYTEPEWQQFFEELCPPPTPSEAAQFPGKLTVITQWGTPWRVPCNRDNYRTYMEQWTKDGEKDIHNPDLYATWRAKPCLLNHTAHLYPPRRDPRSLLYWWVDAGMFRSDINVTNWPNLQRASEAYSMIGDGEMLFSGVWRFYPGEKGYHVGLGPVHGSHICGCFFGGHFRAVTEYALRYSMLHDKFKEAGHFVGKDQDIMNALALMRPNNSWMIPGEETVDCFDQGHWFGSQLFFADPNPARKCGFKTLHPVTVFEYFRS